MSASPFWLACRHRGSDTVEIERKVPCAAATQLPPYNGSPAAVRSSGAVRWSWGQATDAN